MPETSLPDLCDAFGDVLSVLDPVFRSYGGRSSFRGPVRTVKCYEDNSMVGERLRSKGEGCVLVVDGGGSLRCALVGDKLAQAGLDNGWAGVIVFGCVRDVAELDRIDFGIQALAAHPKRSVKNGVGEVDVALRFAGVNFLPDQYLYADTNGVAVAPYEIVDAKG